MSGRINPIFYVLIGLAVFGVVSFLITDPSQFFKYLLMTVGFAALLFVVFYFILNRNRSSGTSNQYKKAVRQSKRKYGTTSERNQYTTAVRSQQKSKINNKKRPKKTATHLRVIEGKKDKKRSSI